MKGKIIKILCICISVFMAISTSGCWDRRDFEKFTLIKGIAIDITENNRVKLSVQMVTPHPGEEGGGRGGADNQSNSNYYVASATGYSIYEANRNLLKQTGKKPFYGHNEVIIFSEELARKGLAPYLDYFIREPEIRGRTLIVIARGKAADILKTPHNVEPFTSTGIRYMIDGVSISGTVLTETLITFLKDYFNDNTDPVAASIELRKPAPQQPEGETEEKSDNPKLLIANGGAMFSADKLADWLTRKEARGLNWVRVPGDVRGPILINPPDEPPDRKTAIEITRSKSKLEAKMNNGEFKMNIYIESEGAIIEDMNKNYDIVPEENMKQLDKYYAQVIKNEVINAIRKSQEYGADIFGLGEAIYRKYPSEFMKIKTRWDQLYKTLPVIVHVTADIRRAGMLKEGVGTHRE